MVFYIIIHADDNTLSFIHKRTLFMKTILETDYIPLVDWFDTNFMQANPDKFQAICLRSSQKYYLF